MMSPEEIRRKQVKDLAYALGIAFYLSKDGRITQRGPGERFDPPPPEPTISDGPPASQSSNA